MIPQPYADLIRVVLMTASGWLIVAEIFLMVAHKTWRRQISEVGPVGQRLTIAATGVSVMCLGIILGVWFMVGKPATVGALVVLVGLVMLAYAVTGMMRDSQRRIR